MIPKIKQGFMKRADYGYHCSSFTWTGIKNVEEAGLLDINSFRLLNGPSRIQFKSNKLLGLRNNLQKQKTDFHNRCLIKNKLINQPSNNFSRAYTDPGILGKDIMHGDHWK